MPLRIERVQLAKLHEDPANARHHDDRNLDSIRASLSEPWGQVEPLVVQRSSGRIIGGNGRYRVMRDLAWEETDVVYLDVDDTQATRLALALNRTAELARWDDTTLAKLLTGLQAQGQSVPGWSNDDIEALLRGVNLGLGIGGTPEGNTQGFLNSAIRQLVLIMPQGQYEDVIERLEALMKTHGLDSHTEAFLFLLDHYENTKDEPPEGSKE